MTTKGFASSVMLGMEEMRSAARHAIESLDHQALMAEDFPASSKTPRGACLQGVGEANAVVLLLGERYGTVQASGLSATEEEVEEARRLGTPVYVCLTTEQRAEDQEAFLGRLSNWANGVTRRTCASPEVLQREIVHTLRRIEETPDASETALIVTSNLQRVVPSQRQDTFSYRGPWLGFSWAPAARYRGADESSFFGKVGELVQDTLVAGTGRLLETRPTLENERDGVFVRSRNDDELPLMAWIGFEGAISAGLRIQAEHRSALDFMASMFVSPTHTQERLDGLLAFMQRALDIVDPDRVMDAGLGQACLAQLGQAHFEAPPASTSGGVCINMGGDEDIVVPEAPESVLRSDLRRESRLASTSIERMKREYQRSQG